MANQQTDKLVLYARDLCGNDTVHWKLVNDTVHEEAPTSNEQEPKPSDAYLEVAELLHVNEFAVHGTFNTQNLKAGIYQVALVVKVKTTDPAEDTFLNFHLHQKKGHEKYKTVNLHKYEAHTWTDIKIDDSVEVTDCDHELGQVELTITKVGTNYWTEKILLVDAVVMKLVQELGKEPAKTSG
ncbi:hypothetical protein Patl1_12030 [Pistacia atlantica]|uniref:Uncharacterized protein n=1 Tax=Pistacia atlantica TaxID=434234 RepID=A0ACC1A7U2_9ROSI|nr:hypothetical protein Patl1_12030 [Pistacia atlantica]